MKRDIKAHKIKPNYRSNIPRLRLYLDIETNKPDKGEVGLMNFRLACTIFENYNKSNKTIREEIKHFWNLGDLALYILSKTQKRMRLNIYTHNAEFDVWASGILPALTKARWKMKFFYAKGMIFILCCKKDGASIWFISSTNYYPMSLSKLGQIFNLPKFDTDVFTEDNNLLLDYCSRDTQIVKVIMHSWFKFIQDGQYGGYALTIPAQAFKAFRYRFYEYMIYPHWEEDVKKLEKRSYFGGRTENFYKGKLKDGPFVKLDFNSNYAYVMQNNSFPTRLLDLFGSIRNDHLSELLEGNLTVADVVVNTNERVYPVRCGKKVVFPVGTFKCTLCSEGLQYAIDHKHLVRIIKGAVYEGRFIFRQYINHFFPLRLAAKAEGNTILDIMLKLMQNALYGKFGENHITYENKEEYTGQDCYRRVVTAAGCGQIGVETKLLNLIQSPTGKEDTNHTFYAICSHVTEYARFLLWRVFMALGMDNVYYCDTDSIITKERYLPLIADFLDDEKLGGLKNEGSSESIILEAPKWYKFAGEWTSKGLPKSAVQVEPNKWEYYTFEKSAGMMKKGLSEGIIRKKVRKTFTLDVTKGKLTSCGKIEPFVLPFDGLLLPL